METCCSEHSIAKCRAPTKEDFKVLKKISGGAYGKVYLVKRVHERSGAEYYYALKSMDKAHLKEKNLLHRVLEERQALSTIDCRFVVRIYFSFVTNQTIDFVMEYVEGGDVASLLIRHRRETKELGLSEDHARFYVAEVLLALEYLHERRITHRDVKPDNMLIDRNGHIKLTDFGFAYVPTDYRDRSPTAHVPSPNTGENKSRSPAARESLQQGLISPEQLALLSCVANTSSMPNVNVLSPTTTCNASNVKIHEAPPQIVIETTGMAARNINVTMTRSHSVPEGRSDEECEVQLRSKNVNRASRAASSCSSTISDCTSVACSLEHPIQQLARLNVHDSFVLRDEYNEQADNFQVKIAEEGSPVGPLPCQSSLRRCVTEATCSQLSDSLLLVDRENAGSRAVGFVEKAACRRPLAHCNRMHVQNKQSRKCGLANVQPVTPTGNCIRPARKRSVQERAVLLSNRKDSGKQKRLSAPRFDQFELPYAAATGSVHPPLNRTLSLNLVSNERRMSKLQLQDSESDCKFNYMLHDENSRLPFGLDESDAAIEFARSQRNSRGNSTNNSSSLWLDCNSNSVSNSNSSSFIARSLSEKASFGSASSLQLDCNSDADADQIKLGSLLDMQQRVNPEVMRLNQVSGHMSSLDYEQEQPRRDFRTGDVSTWFASSSPLGLGHAQRDAAFSRRNSPLQLNSTACNWHLPCSHERMNVSPLACKFNADGFLHEFGHSVIRAPCSPSYTDCSRATLTRLPIASEGHDKLTTDADADAEAAVDCDVCSLADKCAEKSNTLNVTPPHAVDLACNNVDRNANADATGYESDADSTTTRCSDRSRCLGTLPYMAPELWEPKAPRLSELPKVDVWALGVCLFEFLFGILPFGCEHSTVSSNHDEYGEIVEQIRNIESLDVEGQASLLEMNLSKSAISAIRSLLRKSAADRPTASQFRQHEFFRNYLDLDRIHQLQAPWKPPLSNRLDTQLFRENLERRGCAVMSNSDA